MKTTCQVLLAISVLMFSHFSFAQGSTDKKFSAVIGADYFNSILDDEGVMYNNAEFAPEIGFGFSYFGSFDYKLKPSFHIGLGFNGSYAASEFIKNAVVDGSMVQGYLRAGAVANSKVMLNLTYAPDGENFRPFAKLGIGYFKFQVEMGDVPLSLTDNVETELFPDYKSSGLGILPEIGMSYKSFSLSAGYMLPFTELTGEKVADVPPSVGSIRSHGIQVNLSYRFLLF